MASHNRQPELGRRLREWRIERGMSQRDVAGDMVNPSYISLLESGARVPTLDVVLYLARVLDVPLSALIDEADLSTMAESHRVEGGQLVQDLLARSAWDSGDLASAQGRLTEAYRASVASGPLVSILKNGLALGEILALRSDHASRYDLMLELSTAAAAAGIPELVIKVRIDRAGAARDTGRFADALDQATQAMHELTETAFVNSSEHVKLISVLISVLCDSGDSAGVARLIDDMLLVAKQIGSPPLTGRAHWTASVALGRLGDAAGAVQHIRYATELLANPGTPLRDWARFCRASASALLAADAELPEVEEHLEAARVALRAADLPGEAPLMKSIEVRYALASNDPQRAIDLSVALDESDLSGFELFQFVLAKGRALYRLGQRDEGAREIRRSAQICEDLAAFQLAARIWRELDDLRSA